jgi:tRNA nucleotidyltransferase (CCA-adding enzyme)
MKKSPNLGVHSLLLPSKALTILTERLKEPAVRKITKALLSLGQIYIVGGALRDAVSGAIPRDLDFATDVDAETIAESLTKLGIRVVPTGISHGTVLVVGKDISIEVTTFRSPSNRYQSKRGHSIEEDLAGRDFTVNALAWKLSSSGELLGDLIDPFNGFSHINEKYICGVSPVIDRFKEDPLRILRMVRFGPAIGWTVDSATTQAAVTCASELASVSCERIRDELSSIIVASNAGTALKFMAKNCLLEFTLPELMPAIGCEQNEFHTEDVFNHICSVVDRSPHHSLSLRLSALFHDIGKPATLSIRPDGRRNFYLHEIESEKIATKIMERLRFPRKLIKQVALLVRYHMRPLSCGPAGVRRLRRDLAEDFELWKELKRADKTPVCSEEDFIAEMTRFNSLCKEEDERIEQANRPTRLAITGTDIVLLGIPSGPIIGKILKELEEEIILDPSKNTRVHLLQLAEKILTDSSTN